MKSAVTIGLHGGRPTQTQIDRTAVCEKEAAQFAATFDKLAGAEMDGLNAKLKGANLPPLRRLSRAEFDKRQSN